MVELGIVVPWSAVALLRSCVGSLRLLLDRPLLCQSALLPAALAHVGSCLRTFCTLYAYMISSILFIVFVAVRSSPARAGSMWFG